MDFIYENQIEPVPIQEGTVANNPEDMGDSSTQIEEALLKATVQIDQAANSGDNPLIAARPEMDHVQAFDSKLTPRSRIAIWHDDCRHAYLWHSALNAIGLPRIHPMLTLNIAHIQRIVKEGGAPAHYKWFGCKSILHDVDTIRRHVLAFHYHQNLIGRSECWIGRCVKRERRGQTHKFSVPIFACFYEWMDHINLDHYPSVYKGPRYSGSSGDPQQYSIPTIHEQQPDNNETHEDEELYVLEAVEGPATSNQVRSAASERGEQASTGHSLQWAPVELSTSRAKNLDPNCQVFSLQRDFVRANLEQARAVYVSELPAIATIPDGWGVRHDVVYGYYFFVRLH